MLVYDKVSDSLVVVRYEISATFPYLSTTQKGREKQRDLFLLRKVSQISRTFKLLEMKKYVGAKNASERKRKKARNPRK